MDCPGENSAPIRRRNLKSERFEKRTMAISLLVLDLNINGELIKWT